MKAYSSFNNKKKLHFSNPVTTFHDPLDMLYYPIRTSTNMDVQPPTMLFLNDIEKPKGELE